MNVIWDELPRKAWNEFHAQNGGSLQQSWAYGEAMRTLGVQVRRAALMQERKVLAVAQFIGRRIAGFIGLATCTRGPVWSAGLNSQLQNTFYRQLKKTIGLKPLRVCLFSPDQVSAELDREMFKGFSRVMSGYSTVTLDLSQAEASLRNALEGKWRNRLVKAEAESDWVVEMGAHRKLCDQLLQHEEEQRVAKKFHGLPTAFVPAYIEAHDKAAPGYLLASVHRDGVQLASMLFLLYGKAACYYMGWADQDGRKRNAHNLLLWRAMLHLKKQGFRQLDLGGVNTHDLPGISRFKLATGGQVLTLAGTYF